MIVEAPGEQSEDRHHEQGEAERVVTECLIRQPTGTRPTEGWSIRRDRYAEVGKEADGSTRCLDKRAAHNEADTNLRISSSQGNPETRVSSLHRGLALGPADSHLHAGDWII
jgi:hypothetical protein